MSTFVLKGTSRCLFLLISLSLSMKAQTYDLLYQFKTGPDGAVPYAPLVRDAAGNLYGTTTAGGTSLACAGGCGTVFKIDTSGNETILHNFGHGKDGSTPYGGLVLDSKKTLYGTTLRGGSHGAGTVFKLTSVGKMTILHNFTGGKDGGYPYAGLVRDSSGNLYGTTFLGGSCEGFYGCGTVFKVNTQGKESALYSFAGGLNDGAFPYAGVVRDSKGNLYGATFGGGSSDCIPNGCGTVFEISPSGKETFLHVMGNNVFLYGGVVRDSSGNLYGVSSSGGAHNYGSVFMVDPSGQETTIYSFGLSDGGFPEGTLVRDKAGNLYGTTYIGGAYYAGTVFKLDTAANLTTLYTFTGGDDGSNPYAGLVRDASGNLYGTTISGGVTQSGVVFEIKP